LGKFGAAVSELLWGESVGWGNSNGRIGEKIGLCRGVNGFNAHWVVGGVRVRREIRAFEGVEISDGREKRGKEVF
jgi:hypothetical protein